MVTKLKGVIVIYLSVDLNLSMHIHISIYSTIKARKSLDKYLLFIVHLMLHPTINVPRTHFQERKVGTDFPEFIAP